MKLVNLTTLLIVTLSLSTLSFNTRKVTKSHTKLNLASNLAKIAHDMAYSKTTSETDFFLDGGIVGQNAFQASYGTLKDDPTVAVLVFRGTVPQEFSNIKADVKSNLVALTTKTFKPCAKCLVHEGFRDAYKNNLREALRLKFTPFIKEKKVKSIYFIGHSLGGALATLAVYDTGVYLATQKITSMKLGLVTFGAPRVGNADFAKYINEDLGLSVNLRITYKADPIISVPWETTYVHCGSEYHFTDTKLFGNGASNKDNSPRTKGAWDTIFKLVANIGDHSGYSSLDDKVLVDIISHAKKTFKKLK